MLNGKKVSRGNSEKLYVQLYFILKGLIESESWPVNTRIPSGRELCKTHDVSSATVNAAISHLVNKGFLERKQGKGTFVSDWKRSGKPAPEFGHESVEDISHNLNNPLAIIGEKAGWLKDLLSEEEKGAVKHYGEYRDIAEKIRIQISRARNVTHRISGLPQKLEVIKKGRNNGG